MTISETLLRYRFAPHSCPLDSWAMGRIQSSVGLVTGIPIQDTVDKLMAIQAQPRDTLTARQKDLQAQQAAVTQLTALTLGVQIVAKRLAKSDLFAGLQTTSSNTAV